MVYTISQYTVRGRITDPRNLGISLSTPEVRKLRDDPDPEGSGWGKTFIFAVSASLEVHIAPDSDRSQINAVKHETLFHNANVLAAGEICVKDGVVHSINDHSGSYSTDGHLELDPAFSTAVLRAFEQNGLALTDRLRDELTNLSQP